MLRGVKGSEGEGGTQMHSVSEEIYWEQAEIKVNKQAGVISQVIRYITVQKHEAEGKWARARKQGRYQKSDRNITMNNKQRIHKTKD